MTATAGITSDTGSNLEPDASIRPDDLDLEWQTEWLREQAKKHRLQMRIAYEVAADFQMKLMHVTGLGWFRYDKTHWVADDADKGATSAVMKTIRRLAADAVADKDLYSDLVKAQTAAGAKGVLSLAAGMPGISVQATELDADPFVLNTPSGLLDLKSFELRPHDPLDRVTKVTRGSFDPSARCDKWTAFLEQILPDPGVRAYLQRVLGVALVGKQLEHILVIATGTGRNGKGVTYEAVGWAIGDYTHYAPSTLFERTKGNANGASPALFDLRGARFVALSETEKMARIASALLKSLTGGDPVTARGLYKDPITFIASWLILLVTNHLPTLPADDPAVWERVRVIMFDVFIEPEDRDPLLTSKLQDEVDGILTWAVEGLRQYWDRGLAEPEAVKVATNQYASAQDSVARFIEAVCTETPSNGGNTTKELHEAYTEWAAAERIFAEHRLGRTEFGYALDRLGFTSVKKSRGMVRTGLGIASNGGVSVAMQSPDERNVDSAADGGAAVDPWEGLAGAPPPPAYVG